MALIKGEWEGTTFKDFLIQPGKTTEEHHPEKVSTAVNLAGVILQKPYLPAAMRSVVGKKMALEASKNGMMPVAPRGLSIEREAEIVKWVKQHEVKPNEIESVFDPIFVLDDEALGSAIEKVHQYGHSHLPVKNKMAEFLGMFTYASVEHDRMDPATPIKELMEPYKDLQGKEVMDVCSASLTDDQIKEYMIKNGYRMIPIVDDIGRLKKLVFMQQDEAYKIGAAIDTHEGWEERVKALVEAGADMIFIDTSDGLSVYEGNVITKYKEMFPKGPPICAGNIVTPEGFRFLADKGADVIKVGMGPGSICTTNYVLGIGGPPFSSLKHVVEERDKYTKQTGKDIPIIVDGGISDTQDIAIALTHADAIMAGKLFAGFHESAGEVIMIKGEKYKSYWGEGSKRAAEMSGEMKRYRRGSKNTLYQGIDSLVPLKGWFKPGAEEYIKALRLALSHTGSKNLKEFRERAVLVRLSERARDVTKPHGVIRRED